MRGKRLATLTEAEAEALLHDWGFWARPTQLPPAGEWTTWLVMAGRGYGKTRTGAEWIRAEVHAGRRGRLALVAEDAGDARDVMVEGESGILEISPPWFRPHYEPSKRRLTWPNGAIATTYSAKDPDQIRGPQHDGYWADEIAKWPYVDAWDNLMLGLRLGAKPRGVATTTPKPVALIRRLVAREGRDVVITRGSTYENLENLAEAFATEILELYEGTRLGRQEIAGELLDDVPGALWSRRMIDELRVAKAPELVRVVVSIDPAVTSGEEADETGIIVAGLGVDGHGYVLADRSCRMSPDGWARRAVTAYGEFSADRIIAEVNNGGDLVETVLRTVDRKVPYRKVHASRGKRVRAEPVAALYEQKKVHHVGAFDALEDQQVAFLPEGSSESPDRVDALVWALTALMVEPRERAKVRVNRRR